MRSKRCDPDVVTYSFLISCHETANRWREVPDLLAQSLPGASHQEVEAYIHGPVLAAHPKLKDHLAELAKVEGLGVGWRQLAEAQGAAPVEASAEVLGAAAALQDMQESPPGYTARRTGRSALLLCSVRLSFLEACGCPSRDQRDRPPAPPAPPLLALLRLEELVRSTFVDARGEECLCEIKFCFTFEEELLAMLLEMLHAPVSSEGSLRALLHCCDGNTAFWALSAHSEKQSCAFQHAKAVTIQTLETEERSIRHMLKRSHLLAPGRADDLRHPIAQAMLAAGLLVPRWAPLRFEIPKAARPFLQEHRARAGSWKHFANKSCRKPGEKKKQSASCNSKAEGERKSSTQQEWINSQHAKLSWPGRLDYNLQVMRHRAEIIRQLDHLDEHGTKKELTEQESVTKAQGQPEISRVRNLDLILRVWREDKDGKAKAGGASEKPMLAAKIVEVRDTYGKMSAKARGAKIHTGPLQLRKALKPRDTTEWVRSMKQPYSYFESSANQPTPKPEKSKGPPAREPRSITGAGRASPLKEKKQEEKNAEKSPDKKEKKAKGGAISDEDPVKAPALGEYDDRTLGRRPWDEGHHIMMSRMNHEASAYFDKPKRKEGEGPPPMRERYVMNDRQLAWNDEPGKPGQLRRTLFDHVGAYSIGGCKDYQMPSYWRKVKDSA
eukprot:g7858.t1